MDRQAEARRSESERHARDMIADAKAKADKARNDANAEAHRVLTEARDEAERTTTAAKREVDNLTKQKEAVTTQLGQMLSGLAGIVPGVGGGAAADGGKSDKEARDRAGSAS
jgi:cell division septum initiation protein DivIVA